MHMPHLAYIGYALINYTITNAGAPSITPRGTFYYDTFTSGFLTFHPETSLSTAVPKKLNDTGPIDIGLHGNTVTLLGGNDYFKILSPEYFELDTTAAGKSESGKLVHFRAGGFVRIDEKLKMIFQGKGAGDMKFGETDFWEPILVDTGDPDLKWLNYRLIFSQGRFLVEKGKAYGFELRLFSPVN